MEWPTHVTFFCLFPSAMPKDMEQLPIEKVRLNSAGKGAGERRAEPVLGGGESVVEGRLALSRPGQPAAHLHGTHLGPSEWCFAWCC